MSQVEEKLRKNIFEDEIYQFQRVYQPSPQDMPIEDLDDNFKKGKIDHEPEYQRKFVWTPQKQSYFIESIIYGIDTPIIYFVEVEREIAGVKRIVKEAIDGRQRLSTIFKFYNNDLKLEGLKEDTPLFNELNNRTYRELDEKFQRAFKAYSIRTITFKIVDRNIDLDTQLKFKYQLFHRYNSGLTALNQQEVRNCQYSQNDFHQIFKEIASSSIFNKLCPYFVDDQRMAGDEFVTLLFLLTLFDDSLEYYAKKSKNPFINDFFERIESSIYNFDKHINDDLDVSDESEESKEDSEINLEQLKSDHLQKVKNEILLNLENINSVYGSFLKGQRHERYLIETLYYQFSNEKRISKSFIKNNSYELGKFINEELKRIENEPYKDGQEFNLIDCYKDKIAHTVRVRYRFKEMKNIIDKYFTQRT